MAYPVHRIDSLSSDLVLDDDMEFAWDLCHTLFSQFKVSEHRRLSPSPDQVLDDMVATARKLYDTLCNESQNLCRPTSHVNPQDQLQSDRSPLFSDSDGCCGHQRRSSRSLHLDQAASVPSGCSSSTANCGSFSCSNSSRCIHNAIAKYLLVSPQDNLTREAVVALIEVYNDRREHMQDPIQIEAAKEEDIAIERAIHRLELLRVEMREAEDRREELEMAYLESDCSCSHPGAAIIDEVTALLDVADQMYKIRERWLLKSLRSKNLANDVVKARKDLKDIGSHELMKDINDLLDEATSLLFRDTKSSCPADHADLPGDGATSPGTQNLGNEEEVPELISADMQGRNGGDDGKESFVEASES
ncbi:uncharacterized protein RSE6_10596 [Rhynchosporium secalis]|uniref:Uncharacterized protein n=1 Tax=Rhynchosporium secalis TaxID=38038 RepID=A0A1E1MKU7_RHYSE|nr:uncharacterized protein RSE6_10596 [Rhynchosporium secalis]